MKRANPGFFDEKKKIFGITSAMGYQDILSKYPCVRIPHRTDTAAIDDWLEENTNGKWIWSSPFHTDYTDYWFTAEEDAVIFKLKWATPLDTNT